MFPIDLRIENKYLISDSDLYVLSRRLQGVMQPDIHQNEGLYMIRSLYFDNYQDECMNENAEGVDNRKKYRIRLYDPASDYIRLEVKEKINGLTKKTSCHLTRAEAQALMQGQAPGGFDSRAPLNALQLQMRMSLMRPKVIISYERTAFVHPAGNVRITFDRNITASPQCRHFLGAQVPCCVPLLPTGMHILEVKYDELIPDHILQVLETGKLVRTAFSKYYLGRMALLGDFSAAGSESAI